MSKESTNYRRNLRHILTNSFNKEELRFLSGDLGVDWDELRGTRKSEKAQDLIANLAMRGRLKGLVDLCKEERPEIDDWPEIPNPDKQIEDEKADLSETERREIFNNLIEKIGPLANSVLQIKSLVEANIGYLSTSQTGNLVRHIASSNLASYIKLDSIRLRDEDLRGINLSSNNSSLVEVDFSRADLTDAFRAEQISAEQT